MFSSEDVKTASLVIDADPGADGEKFFVMRAPRKMTVVGFYAVSEQTQNAGTAITAQLEKWTQGTAVAGTVAAALGGTAVSARLTARTPASQSISSTYKTLDAGDWLVVGYGELGTGWIANDRLQVAVDYVPGVA